MSWTRTSAFAKSTRSRCRCSAIFRAASSAAISTRSSTSCWDEGLRGRDSSASSATPWRPASRTSHPSAPSAAWIAASSSTTNGASIASRCRTDVSGWSATFRDISEQKQAVAAKAYLAAIVDSADDAIIVEGPRRRHSVGATPRPSACSAIPSDELVGRPVRMLIPPDRQSEEDDILARLRKGERVEHFETVRMTKDGRRLDVALTISPVRDDAGAIIGASKIVRDITALKQSEAERMRLLARNGRRHGDAEQRRRDRRLRPRPGQGGPGGHRCGHGIDDGRIRRVLLQRGRTSSGESYTLYTISGVPREAFSKFPMPRNTEVFAPTFKGTAVVRSPDITKDPRYGHNAPHHGMPEGHLPVRSYLAVPVKGRSGDVIGGLFFGHSRRRTASPSSTSASRSASRRGHRSRSRTPGCT